VALKFRGREMAHSEIGFEVINKFIAEIAPFGHPDFQPKLVGRAINLMISPLPRAKRPKNPYQEEDANAGPDKQAVQPASKPKLPVHSPPATPPVNIERADANAPAADFNNNPFNGLEIK
jgi:translation initiation factor IF-3